MSGTQGTVPEVTDDEILAAIGTEYVFAIGMIAVRVWRNRGGKGDPHIVVTQPEPRVPVVAARHVETPLNRLVANGAVGVVTPADRDEYDLRYFSGPRPKAIYYGRVEYLAVGRRKRTEANLRRAAGLAVAEPLRRCGKFAHVQVEPDGSLTLRATAEQATVLLGAITKGD